MSSWGRWSATGDVQNPAKLTHGHRYTRTSIHTDIDTHGHRSLHIGVDLTRRRGPCTSTTFNHTTTAKIYRNGPPLTSTHHNRACAHHPGVIVMARQPAVQVFLKAFKARSTVRFLLYRSVTRFLARLRCRLASIRGYDFCAQTLECASPAMP